MIKSVKNPAVSPLNIPVIVKVISVFFHVKLFIIRMTKMSAPAANAKKNI